MATFRSEVDSLIEQKGRPDGRVLSVFLDVDQSNAANLRRGYVAALRDRLRSIESQLTDDLKSEFLADAGRVLEFIQAYDARARGLVLFADASENFFWKRELQVPVRTEVRWDQTAYVRPLAEMLDDYERYAVALVSRDEARLFTVAMGEIEENREVLSPEKRKRSKQTARDNRMSQSNLQRKDDEHAHWHLKEVAEAMDELAGRYGLDRLVLAGPHEITAELRALLPKRLQGKAINTISLPMDASEQQVLKATLRIEQETERAEETETVENLITAASKDSQAVLGLPGTLEAMRLGRVMKLVYVEGLSVPGSECANCQSLFAGAVDSCAYCGSGVRPASDVVARLVERVIHSGGRAEIVRGAAVERLQSAGRIGAILRF